MSSITTSDLDQLYECLKHHIGDDAMLQGFSEADLEKQVTQSSQDIQLLRQDMHQTVAQLSTRLDQMHSDMCKQNSVIVGIQRDFQMTITDMTSQFKELKNLVALLIQHSPPASTRDTMHSGELSK
jgi:hypothetical protein